MLAQGIASYQCSPATNPNKLNEALAKSLRFRSYRALKPLLVASQTLNEIVNEPEVRCGFYCQINKDDVKQFLKARAPELLSLLTP